MPSFYELEIRWGAAGAFHFLLETEKAANISSRDITAVDLETRFANALRAQEMASLSQAA